MINAAINPARRIREDIEARIRSGEWRPGTRIPIEQELAARYGCARATVSKALGELAAAGLVERRRKAGSFVAQPAVHSAVMTIPDLAELIAARGESYRWEARAIAPVPATNPSALSGRNARGGVFHPRKDVPLDAAPPAAAYVFSAVPPVAQASCLPVTGASCSVAHGFVTRGKMPRSLAGRMPALR